MGRGADDARLDAAVNPALLEEAEELNSVLQEGGREEARAEEAGWRGGRGGGGSEEAAAAAADLAIACHERGA